MNAESESDALLISFGAHVVLHNGRFSANIFFITRKSISGLAKTPLTSPFLKIIKLHVARKVTK